MIILNYGCKTAVEKVEFDTELIIHPFNDRNQPLDSANVAIFSDFEKYKSAMKNYDFSQSIASGISQGGSIKFDNLTPEITYYVACYYLDKLKISGAKIFYDNSEINFQLAIKPRKGSINEVDIATRPASGIVSFLVSESDKSRLPMAVKFNNFNAGIILKSYENTPNAIADSTVNVNAKKGIGYYVVTSSVCSWYGQTDVKGGEQSFVKLAPCEAGKLAFYVEDTTSALFPVKITLNASDLLPDLDKTKANAATDCDTPNLFAVEKGIGSYTYSARSANGKCVWTGQASITINGCTIIKLTKCKQ